jgi:hypothetical protein
MLCTPCGAHAGSSCARGVSPEPTVQHCRLPRTAWHTSARDSQQSDLRQPPEGTAYSSAPQQGLLRQWHPHVPLKVTPAHACHCALRVHIYSQTDGCSALRSGTAAVTHNTRTLHMPPPGDTSMAFDLLCRRCNSSAPRYRPAAACSSSNTQLAGGTEVHS